MNEFTLSLEKIYTFSNYYLWYTLEETGYTRHYIGIGGFDEDKHFKGNSLGGIEKAHREHDIKDTGWKVEDLEAFKLFLKL